MTTRSRTTPWGVKYTTELHLIYRIKDGQLEQLGLFETRKAAETELSLILSKEWQIADICCIGWGIVADVVDRNSGASDYERC